VPSVNEIIVAAAGSGKTTRIVERAISAAGERAALVTYTRNNVREIESRFYEKNKALPGQVEIWPWYTMLLRELARPYRNRLYDRRLDKIVYPEGKSSTYASAANVEKYYFAKPGEIWSDKLGRFVLECNKASDGAVIRRFEKRFDHIYIDEVQDLAGHDLELVELLLKSKITVTLVGDHRQATYRTNNASKNAPYKGIKIIDKFKEWESSGLAKLDYLSETYRCHQSIATFADAFFPMEPQTKSLQDQRTGHDGVFVIPPTDVSHYVMTYSPQVLRLDRRTKCEGYNALNFGEAKGMTFDRVLIFPHKGGRDWLKSGNFQLVEKSASKLYVGVTRARHSVAFVYDGAVNLPGVMTHAATG
jgi:DNA helicase II / ATP-dependent DNA helicase PcrA